MIYACRDCRRKIKHDNDSWEDVGHEYFSKLMRKGPASGITMDYCPDCATKVETRRLKKIVEKAVEDVRKEESNRLREMQAEGEENGQLS